jgi:hypothetical protein
MSPPGVHRWIVEALGDPEAVARVGADGFLAPEEWRLAVERTRLHQFATLAEWDGNVAVGRLVANRFLESEAGRMVSESLRILPLERALGLVAMPISDRMRRSLEFDFRPLPEIGGGCIEVRGELAVSPAVLLGFYESVVKPIQGGKYSIRLSEQAPALIRLEVSLAVP